MAASSHTTPYNLAIETSGRLGSVALGRGSELLETRSFSADLRHGVEMMPTIDSVCRAQGLTPQQIGECYVSAGPGSFTGVRIGIIAARTLALAGGIRIVRVPTLDVIAQNALTLDDPDANLGVILDAKRKKVYAAAYVKENDTYVCTMSPAECDPADFFEQLPRPAALTGEGIDYARQAVEQSGLAVLPQHTRRPRAEVVHQLGHARAVQGDFDNPRELVPIYFRRPEAEEVWRRRHRPA